MKIDNFFAELKRRNVYKVAIAYAVVAWLLMQVASQVSSFSKFPTGWWLIHITISAKVGEVYFIESRTNWGAGFNTAACEIRLMSTEEGTTMLQEFAAA